MAPATVPAVPGSWIAMALLAIALGVGIGLGFPVGLLAAAGAVLVCVILLIWSSVLSLTGSTPLTLDEAVGLGAPSVEEERKQAVLRALKDLEYERSVGKISEDDFRELSTRYRTEAKELLQALDRDLAPYREQVLRRIEQRLGPAKSPAAAEAPSTKAEPDHDREPDDGADAPGHAAPGSSRPRNDVDQSADAPTTACGACGVGNDADARFCKGCGARLEEGEA